jgi:AAA domain
MVAKEKENMSVHPFPQPAPVAPLRLDFFEDCKKEQRKDWLIKGVLAEGEDSTWFGLPGKTKSMLLTDIAVHIASGRDWRGYKTKKKVGVLYLALERATLTKRRLAAYGRLQPRTSLSIYSTSASAIANWKMTSPVPLVPHL